MNQYFDSALFNFPALWLLLAVNAGFFVLGVVITRLWLRVSHDRKLAQSFENGREAAQSELEHEKKTFSQDISVELEKLRDGIIGSARAYKEAVGIIESKIGFSWEDSSRLKLKKGKDDVAEQLLLDATKPQEEPLIEKVLPQETPVSENNRLPSDLLEPSNNDQHLSEAGKADDEKAAIGE